MAGSGVSSAARCRNAAAADSPPARLRPVGRALQFAGYGLVGPVGRTSAMPRPAIRVQPRVGRVGEGPMDLASLGCGRGPVGGRTDERMTEPHARADLDQACRLGRSRRLGPDAELLGRAPQQRHVADRLRRRQQQQAPGLGRERRQLPYEALLDTAGQRHLHGQPESARDRDRLPPARQLEQRERVAAGLAEDPVPNPRVERPGDRRVQQPAGVVGDQALDHELRQSLELVLVAGLAQREHQSHPLRQQASRHERECLHGHLVEPLRVVDDADQRLLLGGVGQQAQDGQADQEAIRRRAGAQAERRVQRVALRDRQISASWSPILKLGTSGPGDPDAATDGGTVRFAPVLFQPIAEDDAVHAVGRISVGPPLNGKVEVAGPEQFRMDEFFRNALATRDDPRTVVTDPHASFFGRPGASTLARGERQMPAGLVAQVG